MGVCGGRAFTPIGDRRNNITILIMFKRKYEQLLANAKDYIHYVHGKIKHYKYLYQKMLDRNIIKLAYKKLRKGKTKRKEIQMIDADLDNEVEAIRETILNTRPCEVPNPEKAYRPHKRTPKIICEHGKFRKIYMPEIHEQWIHHIIVLVLEPIIMKTAYPYSCGSFPKRGAHYGKKRIVKWIRSGKGIRNYVKIDIRHFYESIILWILMRELAIRIKDEWFLYIIRLCLKGFKKGIPLGFYISQWLANYILEPLDYFIHEVLELHKMIRYMDDIFIFGDNKKILHGAIIQIKMLIGRRFRLKLKRNHTVCKFWYRKKNGKVIGRIVDYMGFLFDREKVLMRKGILIAATRLARKMAEAKKNDRPYYLRRIRSMLSYMGWFDATNTYDCYLARIKPYVNIGNMKKIVSKIDRRANNGLERGTLLNAA